MSAHTSRLVAAVLGGMVIGGGLVGLFLKRNQNEKKVVVKDEKSAATEATVKVSQKSFPIHAVCVLRGDAVTGGSSLLCAVLA